MATVADVVNLGLGHLSEKADVVSISPPDASYKAQTAAKFFPIARDALLEMHGWAFSTVRAALVKVDLGDDQPDSWQFAYAYPNLCAAVRRVLQPEITDDNQGQDFVVETLASGAKVIYTNVEDATAVYSKLVTDTTKWSALFVICLSYLLADFMCLPLSKKADVQQRVQKAFAAYMTQAAKVDSNARQNNPYTTQTPSALAARA